MKASEVATEFRRIADALDKAPDLKIQPYLSISPTRIDKDTFLALAKIMPRPMKKGIDFPGESYEKFTLTREFWRIKILRSAICTIKEPARPATYECPSIFTPEEEEEMSSASA